MSARSHRLFALAFLTALVVLVEVFCPYTKVEESFNMQAMYDFLYTHNTDSFDHHMFPGVVPRTFLGAWAIAVLALFPFACVVHGIDVLLSTVSHTRASLVDRLLHEQPMLASHVCRISLAAVVLASLYAVAVALDAKRHARRGQAQRPASSSSSIGSLLSSRGSIFLLLCAIQFHLVLYASRPLPNTFGLIFCNIALQQTLVGRLGGGVAALTAGAALFRCDILALLAPYGLYAVLIGTEAEVNAERKAAEGRLSAKDGDMEKEGSTKPAGHAQAAGEQQQQREAKRLSLLRGITVGLTTAAACVGLTAPGLDSFLWGRWLWPEGVVFFFNTKENRSGEWGVMPWHWYWSKALLRALLFVYPAVLVLAACVVGQLCLRRTPLLPSFIGRLQRRALRWVTDAKPFRVARECETVLVPALAFIALYSALPHKELRFILVAFPWLLAPVAVLLSEEDEDDTRDRGEGGVREGAPQDGRQRAASGVLTRVVQRIRAAFTRATRAVRRLLLVGVFMMMLASVALSIVVTEGNYPGSEALQRLHAQIAADAVAGATAASFGDLAASLPLCLPKRIERAMAEATAGDASAARSAPPHVNVTVFVDAYAAMTGINRFQKRHTPVVVPASPFAAASLQQRQRTDFFFTNDARATAREGGGRGRDTSEVWRRWLRLLRLPVEALGGRAAACLSSSVPASVSDKPGGSAEPTGPFAFLTHALQSAQQRLPRLVPASAASEEVSAGWDGNGNARCRYAFVQGDEAVTAAEGKATHATPRPHDQPTSLAQQHQEKQQPSAAALVWLKYTKDPHLFLTPHEHAAQRTAAAGSGPNARAEASRGTGGQAVGEVYRPSGIDYALVRATQRELHLVLHDDFELLFTVEERSTQILQQARRLGGQVVRTASRLLRLRAGSVKDGAVPSAAPADASGNGAFLLALRRKVCAPSG